MEKLPLIIIFSVLFVGGLLTIILYGFLICKWRSNRRGLNTILLISVFYQTVYSIFGIIHAVYSLFAIVADFEPNGDVMFWTAMPLYSLRMVLPVSSLFVALDRLVATRFPMLYRSTFFGKLSLTVGLTTAAVAVVNVGVYLWKRRDSTASPFILGRYVNSLAIFVLNDVYNGLCVLHILVTVLFLKCFVDFVRLQRKTRSLTSEQYVNVNTTNLIVFYQLLVEFVFEVIPSFATAIASYAFHVNWPQQIGPYVIALQVIYTAICSITYMWKMRVCKSIRTKNPVLIGSSTNHLVTSVASHRLSLNTYV